jgi:hypothetical protein
MDLLLSITQVIHLARGLASNLRGDDCNGNDYCYSYVYIIIYMEAIY